MIYKKLFKLGLIVGVSCLLSVISPVCVNAYNNSKPFSASDLSTWNQGSNGFKENDTQMLCKLGSSDTIHQGGCGHYAIASMLVKCGYLNPKLESPVDVVKFAYKHDLYNTEWGHFDPNKIGRLNSDLECVSEGFNLEGYSTEDALAYLKKKYLEGYFLMVCLRSDGLTGGHYIFIDKFTDDGEISITDSGFAGTKWSDTYGKRKTIIQYVNVYRSKSGKKCNELKSVYDIQGGDKKLFTTGTSEDTRDTGASGSGMSEDELSRYNRLISEWDLVGLPAQFNIDDAQISLEFTTELSTDEEKVVEVIREGIEEREFSWYGTFRVAVVCVGILCCLYGVLFLVAYLFDRSNNFIDIRLLSVISFGRYAASSEEGYSSSVESGRVTYMTTGMVVRRFIVLEVVGLMLVTGVVYRVVRILVSFLLEFIDSLV